MDNRAARTKREVTDCMVDGEPWRTGTLRLARGPGITSGRGINIVVVDLARGRKCQHPQAKYCRYVLFHRITLGAEVESALPKPLSRTEGQKTSGFHGGTRAKMQATESRVNSPRSHIEYLR